MEDSARHFLNGKLVKENELLISARDLGYTRDYAIFDFLITYPPQRPFMLERHLDRLFNSAEIINFAIPWNKDEIRKWVLETLAANKDGQEKKIKIILSGGVSDSLLPKGNPTVVITVDTRHPYPSEWYEKGITLNAIKFQRYEPAAKTNNYIEAVRQTIAGQKIGAEEPIYYDESQVLECAKSNVFALVGGKLLTPKSNILKGVTRNVLLEIVKLDIPVEERDFTFAELLAAPEVFITGSLTEIAPVTRIDDKTIGDGAVGPVSKEVMKQFREFTLSDKW
jgi:branched-subunit amino acid aminotransferase/4-amino-4-deoxychorismate lyase